MKIGITERGDPSLSFKWEEKLPSVDGAIIITKNLTSNEFLGRILKHKDKLIVHSTITGLGGTFIEENVPPLTKSLRALEKLVNNGFDPEQIVLRIDPLFHEMQEKAIPYMVLYVDRLKIKRVRISFLDFYPHVIKRFQEHGLEIENDGFKLPDKKIKQFLNKFVELKELFPHISFEACGETIPKDYRDIIESIGCISEKDLDILKIPYLHEIMGKSQQRKSCKCLDCKTELLNQKSRCKHECLYCYWRD